MVSLKRTLQNYFKPWGINSKNKNFKYISNHIPIYGTYHIFAFNDWINIVTEQLNALVESGLSEVTDILYISLIYQDKNQISELEQILNKFTIKYKFINLSDNPKDYEFPALNFMHKKALGQENEAFYYYFHTKGASYSSDTVKNYAHQRVSKLESLKRNSRGWRLMMEYWVFQNWKLAVSTLQNGYDAYGAKIFYNKTKEIKFFGGNFWWTTSNHLKTRVLLNQNSSASRYEAETWILSKCDNYYCPFYCIPVLTHLLIPESCYTGKGYKIIEKSKFYLGHLADTLNPKFKMIFKRK